MTTGPRTFTFKPGEVWYVGIDRPFLATDAAIRTGIAALGATVLELVDRDAREPTAVSPKSDPGYSDDWDQWLVLRIDAKEAKSVAMPAAVRWIVRASDGSVSPPLKPPSPPTTSPPTTSPPTTSPPTTSRGGASTGVLLVLLLIATSMQKR